MEKYLVSEKMNRKIEVDKNSRQKQNEKWEILKRKQV